MTLDEDRDRLDLLVQRYLERVDGGEAASVVLEELCTDNRTDADRLRHGVALLRDVQLHPGPARDGMPERIGDFRLVRKLGAGGMGVVWLADQGTPARRVALKLVRPDQLYFEGTRARFEREVASAARLSHPGIAAIFEVGESDGLPWFSQEYVVGASLDAIAREAPARSPEGLTGADMRAALEIAMSAQSEDVDVGAWDEDFFRGSWVEVCMRIARQVADALQHAHERSVLHRDVKPSNVLLTPSGRAVLVDFGLATLGGADALTRTGALLGSLPYMPPEIVDGRSRDVGPATDVYSLGVTLYELFALRAPYSSKSEHRIRGLILEGDAVSPRHWNTAVPLDAATVCMCAMDRDAGRRYPTASAFASDIANVLAHRPPAARPIGTWLRAVRWCQRHPALATASVLGLLLVCIVPTALAIQTSRAAARNDAHFKSALAAVEFVMRRLGDRALDDLPGLAIVRLEVAERALEIFTTLEAERPDDPSVRLQRAKLLRSRGALLAELGRHDDAQADYEEACRTLRAVVDAQPTAYLLQFHGTLCNDFAHALEERRLWAEALPLQREAVAALERALELEPDAAMSHSDLARVLCNLSETLRASTGDADEIEALTARALDLARESVRLQPDGNNQQRALYSAHLQRAFNHAVADQDAAARVEYELALDAIEVALALDPNDRQSRSQEATVLSFLGLTLSELGELERSERHLVRAVDALDSLCESYPHNEDFSGQRMSAVSALSNVLRLRGDHARAQEMIEVIARARSEQAQRDPTDLRAAAEAATEWANLSNYVLMDESRGDERYELVVAHGERAREHAELLRVSQPDAAQTAGVLFFLESSSAVARARMGELDEARAAIDRMVALEYGHPEAWLFIADTWAEWTAAARIEAAPANTDWTEGREQALAALQAAFAAGFTNVARMRESEALNAFEDDPRYGKLVEAMRAARGAGE